MTSPRALALPLLVLRVLADHAHDALAPDDPALVADLAHRRPDLHLPSVPAASPGPASAGSEGFGSRRARRSAGARVSTSGSPSVTSTVCSKWADGAPSTVTAVHSSSRMRTPGAPRFTIGSIAKTMPGTSRGPRPGAP